MDLTTYRKDDIVYVPMVTSEILLLEEGDSIYAVTRRNMVNGCPKEIKAEVFDCFKKGGKNETLVCVKGGTQYLFRDIYERVV